MHSGIKVGSRGSFSVVHDELIISGGDKLKLDYLPRLELEMPSDSGDNHHPDERGNPTTTSLSSSGAESHYQTFTGKSIILASTA